MKTLPKYDNGEDIVLDRGLYGICSEVSASMAEYLFDNTDSYSIEDEINGTCEIADHLPPVDVMLKKIQDHLPETGQKKSHSAPRDCSAAVSCKLEIEFIHFGKADVFPAEAFDPMASIWHQGHRRECRILLNSIAMDKIAHEEWLKILDEFVIIEKLAKFVAWVEKLWSDGVDAVGLVEFDNLYKRVEQLNQDFLDSPQLTYQSIREVGIQLEILRNAHLELSTRASKYREQVMSGAADGEKIAVVTEWAAFKFNDNVAKLAANISAKGNPLVEAGYRLTFVVFPKTLGRGIGEWTSLTANDKAFWAKDGNGRKVFKSISGVFVSDGSGILTDLIMGIAEKSLGKLGDKSGIACKFVIRGIIETLFIVIDAAVFDKKPEEVLRKLAMIAAQRMASSLVKISGTDNKRLSDAVANVADIAVEAIRLSIEESEKRGVHYANILLENAPFILVKMVAGFAIAFFTQKGGSLDNWGLNRKIQTDIRSSLRSEEDITRMHSESTRGDKTSYVDKSLKNEGRQNPPANVTIKNNHEAQTVQGADVGNTAVVKINPIRDFKIPPVITPTPDDIKNQPRFPTRSEKRAENEYWTRREQKKAVSTKAKTRR